MSPPPVVLVTGTTTAREDWAGSRIAILLS